MNPGIRSLPSNTATTSNVGSFPKNNAASLKNEFMTLMMAQVKNQDPSNPQDANQYVSQLAQFSQVESLEKMSHNQNAQLQAMSDLGMVQSASLIGKSALVPAQSFDIDKASINGKIHIPQQISALNVKITNEQGEVVDNLQMGAQSAGDKAFTLDPSKLNLSKGRYHLQISAFSGQDKVPVEGYLQAPIKKIHFGAGNQMIAELGNGLGRIPVLGITEVSQ